jgi:hypothetical protein
MQSDFFAACKRVNARVPVPPVPHAAIRQALQDGSIPGTGRRRSLVWSLVLSVSLVAAAAAAQIWIGPHVSFPSMGGVQLSGDSRTLPKRTDNPTDDDLRSAVKRADFPVVLPAGLAQNIRPVMLVRYGSGAMMLEYNLPGAWRHSNHLLQIILANPMSLNAPSRRVNPKDNFRIIIGHSVAKGGIHWRIGHEDVLVYSNTLTPAELAHIKSAMLARASARQ